MSEHKETNATIQDEDCLSMNYIKIDKNDSLWAAKNETKINTASNVNFISGKRSMGTSMDIFVQ